jgi:hypothetical protein
MAGSWVAGPLDELAVDERCACADERDQVRGIDHAPPALGGLDQLERHRQPGRLRPVALGDLGPEPDRGEGRLD